MFCSKLLNRPVFLRKFSTSNTSKAKLKEDPVVIQQREERKKTQRLDILKQSTAHLPAFNQTISNHIPHFHPLKRQTTEEGGTTTLQINIGKRCNLICKHCHVESGPTRTENMERKTAERLVHLIKNSPNVHTVDLTGGAPELNSNFKYIVEESRKSNKNVIDRCNLTVFYEEGMSDIPEFLAKNKVQVVASLPCYGPVNVEKQRGKGVWDPSVKALQLLNNLGYGVPGTGLELHLVYNPGGAFLPGAQPKLEQDYKKQLFDNFGIVFNNLFTITNMPIKRFADDLYRLGEYEKYMRLLVDSFNKDTVQGLMCRNIVNVSWDGTLYDCDFNQALDMDLGWKKTTVWDIDSVADVNGKVIATDKHCYGCSAGSGSSCTGSLA